MEADVNVADRTEIRLGLPERHRRDAAELYYQAFRQKFEPVMGSREHGVAILAKTFDPELAIVALHQDQLAGVAGVQYGGRHFVDFEMSAFVQEFGWLRGPFKLLLLLAFARRQRKGELSMDGIVVHPSMRGQGIGTRLLQTVFDFAQTNGFGSVRLEVVDTNPGARRLYERMGFVPTKTKEYPYLRRAMGFSAVTTMIKQLASNHGAGSANEFGQERNAPA